VQLPTVSTVRRIFLTFRVCCLIAGWGMRNCSRRCLNGQRV
jgi:hypothetical protein